MNQQVDGIALMDIIPDPEKLPNQTEAPPIPTLPSQQRRQIAAKRTATFAVPAQVNNENTVNGVPLQLTPTSKKAGRKRKRANDNADQLTPSKRQALHTLEDTNNPVKLEPEIKREPYYDFKGVQLLPEEKLASTIPVVTEGVDFIEIQPGNFTAVLGPPEGGLYLGNVHVATNVEWQRSIPIHVVVNAAKELQLSYHVPEIQFHANLVDVSEEKLDSYVVQQVLESMHLLRTSGKSVLVHCKLGRSRSVALIICYLMVKCSKTLLEAVEMLKSRDVDVHALNDGFKEQLMEIDRYQNGSYTYVFYDKATRRLRAARQWQPFNEASRQNQARLAARPKRTPAKKTAAKKAAVQKTTKTTPPRKPRAKKTALATQPVNTQPPPSSPLNTAAGALEAPRSPSKRQATLEETIQLYEEKLQATQQQTEEPADAKSDQIRL